MNMCEGRCTVMRVPEDRKQMRISGPKRKEVTQG
jgi:hypothetical protein